MKKLLLVVSILFSTQVFSSQDINYSKGIFCAGSRNYPHAISIKVKYSPKRIIDIPSAVYVNGIIDTFGPYSYNRDGKLRINWGMYGKFYLSIKLDEVFSRGGKHFVSGKSNLFASKLLCRVHLKK